jgi:hypothetical protein
VRCLCALRTASTSSLGATMSIITVL